MTCEPPSSTVGEIAAATGLSVLVLRHWEALGLLSPSRSSSGHRRFTSQDLTRVSQVVALRRTGLSLSDVAAALDGDRVSTEQLLRRHLLELDLRQRGAVRDRLAGALASAQPR